MKMKKNRCSIIVAFSMVLLFTFAVIVLFPLNRVKFAEDYSSLDARRAQKVVLGCVEATEDIIEKYDMNLDGKITNTDVHIIQQMVLRFYDSYEANGDIRNAVKNINE